MFKPHHRHYLIGFVLDTAVMIAMTATPFIIMHRLQGGPEMMGRIAAVQALCYALLCIVSQGFIARAKHGLHWALLGVSIFGIFYCAAPLVDKPLLFAAAVALGTMGLALTWPALHSWIGAEPDLARRGRRMAVFNISWSLGFTVGPLLAGPLYTSHYLLPYIVAFALTGVTLALIFLAPHEREYFGVANDEVLEARAGHDQASEVHLYAAWLANAVGNALIGATRAVFPKRVEDLVAAGELRLFAEDVPSRLLPSSAAMTFSWLAFLLAGGSTIMFYLLGRTHRWHHRFSLLALMQVAGAAAFALLGSTRSFGVMAVCCLIIGAALGMCFFAAVYYSSANPKRKHARAAVNEAAVGVGGFVGALAIGTFAERYGMAKPFACTSIAVAAALVIQYALIQRSSRRQKRTAET